MVQKEKAIVVGVNLDNEPYFLYSMEELWNLAAACNVDVVGEITQKLDRVSGSHFIGKGKLQEVADFVEEEGADMVIFNDELSASQLRNLETCLGCEVIDRTLLILSIFAERARTREAKLQVEVAQLQYMLPRLVGLREYLSRQGGGSGLKNKGLGETKLQLDRRRIEDRITVLSKELETLSSQRQTQRKQRVRSQLPVVSLVGYTNAGKSTLMNAMVELSNQSLNKQVLVEDMLFASLETSVRNVTLPDNRSFLLTDTVGFVDRLPHHLVRAFRSTLEEAIGADLLIHVVDYSNPNYERQMSITDETLRQIGIIDIPVIHVYNKVDLTDLSIPIVNNDSVFLSAKHRVGIEELTQLISSRIFRDFVQCEMLVPYAQGQVVSYLNENALVLSTSYEEDGARLVLECRRSDAAKYHCYIV